MKLSETLRLMLDRNTDWLTPDMIDSSKRKKIPLAVVCPAQNDIKLKWVVKFPDQKNDGIRIVLDPNRRTNYLQWYLRNVPNEQRQQEIKILAELRYNTSQDGTIIRNFDWSSRDPEQQTQLAVPNLVPCDIQQTQPRPDNVGHSVGREQYQSQHQHQHQHQHQQQYGQLERQERPIQMDSEHVAPQGDAGHHLHNFQTIAIVAGTDAVLSGTHAVGVSEVMVGVPAVAVFPEAPLVPNPSVRQQQLVSQPLPPVIQVPPAIAQDIMEIDSDSPAPSSIEEQEQELEREQEEQQQPRRQRHEQGHEDEQQRPAPLSRVERDFVLFMFLHDCKPIAVARNLQLRRNDSRSREGWEALTPAIENEFIEIAQMRNVKDTIDVAALARNLADQAEAKSWCMVIESALLLFSVDGSLSWSQDSIRKHNSLRKAYTTYKERHHREPPNDGREADLGRILCARDQQQMPYMEGKAVSQQALYDFLCQKLEAHLSKGDEEMSDDS